MRLVSVGIDMQVKAKRRGTLIGLIARSSLVCKDGPCIAIEKTVPDDKG